MYTNVGILVMGPVLYLVKVMGLVTRKGDYDDRSLLMIRLKIVITSQNRRELEVFNNPKKRTVYRYSK